MGHYRSDREKSWHTISWSYHPSSALEEPSFGFFDSTTGPTHPTTTVFGVPIDLHRHGWLARQSAPSRVHESSSGGAAGDVYPQVGSSTATLYIEPPKTDLTDLVHDPNGYLETLSDIEDAKVHVFEGYARSGCLCRRTIKGDVSADWAADGSDQVSLTITPVTDDVQAVPAPQAEEDPTASWTGSVMIPRKARCLVPPVGSASESLINGWTMSVLGGSDIGRMSSTGNTYMIHVQGDAWLSRSEVTEAEEELRRSLEEGKVAAYRVQRCSTLSERVHGQQAC